MKDKDEKMTGNLIFQRYRRAQDNDDKIVDIDISLVSPNPSQPRKLFADDALLRLADSIRQHGMIQPLTVRRNGNEYLLIAGERRLRAAKLLGSPTVPCVVIEADEKRSAELAIIENLQREDLNMFEEADALHKLIELYGLTQERIAERLSCSQSYVANKLRLLKLSREEKAMIIDKGLTERHARALLRLRDPEVRMSALHTIATRGLNVCASEEYIDALLTRKAEETKKPSRESLGGKFSLKDIRLFYNSIDHALELVRLAGVPATVSKLEDPSGTEITIHIPR